jgi:Ca-activated chloride channel family protein
VGDGQAPPPAARFERERVLDRSSEAPRQERVSADQDARGAPPARQVPAPKAASGAGGSGEAAADGRHRAPHGSGYAAGETDAGAAAKTAPKPLTFRGGSPRVETSTTGERDTAASGAPQSETDNWFKLPDTQPEDLPTARALPAPPPALRPIPSAAPSASTAPAEGKAQEPPTLREEIQVVGEVVPVISEGSLSARSLTATEETKEEERRSLVAAEPEPPLYIAPEPEVSPSAALQPHPQLAQPLIPAQAGGPPLFVDPAVDPYSTFGLDVDTGAYTHGRRYLAKGVLPPPALMRVEEWINAFDYGDPAPRGDDFAVVVQGAPSFFKDDRDYLVRFGIRAREVSREERKPAVLTFVVDVSGSMDEPDRLPLLREALGVLLGELRPDDAVALVVYGDRGRVVLPHTTDAAAVRAALAALTPEGSTNAEEGLRLGYREAARAFRPGAANRVILCSDGVANVGATDVATLLERVAAEADRGIELTTLGFGMGDYNDQLMEQLADRGDGRYAYVDRREEAERVLREELTGTLETVAEDARAQVEWNRSALVGYWRLGYDNRGIADHEYRYDSTDGGEVGAGQTVTAIYEVRLKPGVAPETPLGILRLRYRRPGEQTFREQSWVVRRFDLADTWDDAPPALRLATLVGFTAEILRGGPGAGRADLEDVRRRLRQVVDGVYAGDPRKRELVQLVDLAVQALSRRR